MNEEQLLAKLKQFADVNLTLFNEKGESYRAGKVVTLLHTNKGVKMRWEMNRAFSNIFPLTHAVIHRGRKIWSVVAIRPVPNSEEGSQIELEYR